MTSAFDANARRNLVVDGVLSRLMDVLGGGAFLAAVALASGASNLQFGILAALPFAAQAAQWPVAKVLMRRPQRRIWTVAAATGARLLLAATAVLAVLGLLDAWSLLALLALSTALAMSSSVAWNWWMRDLVPREELGRYFGRRLWAAALAGMAASIAAAVLAARLDRGAAWVLLAGAAAGLAGMLFLARVPHPAASPHQGPLPGLALRQRHEAGPVAGALALVAATLGFALPFAAIFLLRGLGLSLLAATLVAAVSQVGHLLSLRGWGHLSDRHGHRPVLLTALGMLVAALLLFGFMPPAPIGWQVVCVAVAHFVSGYAIGGLDLAAANLALRAAPATEAPLFLARIGMAKAAAGAASALAAGAIWQAVGTGPVFDLAPGAGRWPLVGFQVLALGAAGLALASMLVVARLAEPGASPVRAVAVAMRLEARQMSSVAGVRAFVHTVSFVVAALTPLPRGGFRQGPGQGPGEDGGSGPARPPAPAGPGGAMALTDDGLPAK